MQVFQVALPKRSKLSTLWIGRSLHFTPDGRYLYVPAKDHNFLDTQGDRQRDVLLHNVFGFTSNGALSIACDSVIEGSLVATNISTKNRITHEQKGCVISCGVVGISGKLVYVAVSRPWPPHGGGLESEIWVYNTEPFRKKHVFGRQSEQFQKLTVSASDDRLAAYGFNELSVWNVATEISSSKPLIRVRPRGSIGDFALSNDGLRLASVNGSGLTIWETTNGDQIVHSGKHRRGVTAVACSPTQPTLVTGDNAGQVFLWDHTGRVVTRFDWGLGEVFGLCFAPDGLRCAAVDKSGKVVIWDVDG